VSVSWIIVASIAVQVAAGVAALRMAGSGGRKAGWLVISAAFFVMAVRRVVTLEILVAAPSFWRPGLQFQEFVSLVTSLLMLTGVFLLRPFFRKADEDSISAERLAVAIEGSEAKYRFVVENILEALVVLREGRVLFASPGFSRVFAVGIDDVIGRGLGNFVVASDRELVREALEVAASDAGQTISVEAGIVRRDGSRGWVRIVTYPAEWEGQPVMVGLISDVTERRLAEARLRRSETRYRAIVEDQSELVCRYASDGALTFANEAFSRFFTGKPKMENGGSVFELVAGADQAALRDQLRGLSTYRPFGVFSHSAVSSTGQVAWLQWTNRALFGEAGKLVEIQGVGRDVTERVHAEQELRGSEERYRAMFNSNNAVKLLIDPDTASIVDANEAACKFYGCTLEELQDPTVAAKINNLSRFEALRRLAQARSRGTSSFQVPQRLLSGEAREVEVFSSLIELHGRSLLYAVIVDVTDRVEAERARDRLVHYLRATADVAARLLSAPDPRAAASEVLETLGGTAGADRCYWFEVDDDGQGGSLASQRAEWCAPGVESQRTEPSLQNIRLDELPQAFRCLARGDVVASTIDEMDQESRQFLQAFGVSSVVLIPLFRQGRFGGVIGFDSAAGRRWQLAEVDLLRAAAQAFSLGLDRHDHEDRRRELAAVVEQAVESIILTDTEGLIRYVNPAFARSTGRSYAEIIGVPVGSLQAGAGSDASTSPIESAIAAGESWRGVTQDRRRDGALVPFQTTVFPLTDEQQEVTGFCVLRLDVSKQTQLEEKLRRAQRMEALGGFAGGIAHDFNNLVTVISGAAELLERQTGQADPGREEIAMIQRAVGSATELTRGLLAFARLQPLKPTILDLGQVVEQTLPMLRRLLPSSIEVRTDLDGCSGTVRADRGSLEQALLNLCINSRDAMPGGGTLSLVVRRRSIDADYAASHPWARAISYVGLTVSDTGIGMSKEALDRAFDPFFTTKDQGKGTGLGLAVVYGIAKELGGFVDAASELGRGSQFSMFLPAADGPAPVTRASEPPVELAGTEHVLVVDDHEDLREMVARFLRAHGYAVSEAADGEQALACLEAQPQEIDAVVTDMVMPRMGGRQLMELAHSRWPKVVFVLTTGLADQISVERLVTQPGLGFVAKPYSVVTLIAELRRVLDCPDPHTETT
jgi:PAS domain S-box-containing protein